MVEMGVGKDDEIDVGRYDAAGGEGAHDGLVLQVQTGVDKDRGGAAQKDAVGKGRHPDDVRARLSSW